MRQLPPWQPDGTPVSRSNPGVRLGPERAGSRTEGQSPASRREGMRKATPSGAGGLGENAPWHSSPAPHGFLKARLMGKVFPIIFSNINNNNHYSHLWSTYSKAFTYLRKFLQRSYSFTQHIFIGVRHKSKHLRQIKGRCGQSPRPHGKNLMFD